jgi:site-specific DNA-adenine methylase
VTLKPFFTYYGGKWRVAPKYPTPVHDRIFEPFAGSAGYSLRHPERNIWINDSDPIIVGTWDYLIRASEEEILALPDLVEGQTVNDLDLPQEARWLIGWWLNKGSAQPKLRASSFMLHHAAGGPYWGQSIRERIASQQSAIRHWTVTNYDYEEMPGWRGTWYIDPPYQRAGKHYRYGSEGIDFARLGRWCMSREGQVIVCEADDADWLPFAPLVEVDGTEGRQKAKRAQLEVIWSRGGVFSDLGLFVPTEEL